MTKTTNNGTNLPAAQTSGSALMVIDYGDDEGCGMENISRDEFKIPLMRILQSNSPQCKPVSAGGTEGAVAGMIYNTATGEMWSGENGLLFIPVDRDHNYIEYVPRDAGGGFVGTYDIDDPVVGNLREKQGKFGKLTMDSGNELVETFYLFGLIIPPDGTTIQGVVPFTSTQISKYQAFMTRYQSITYPNAAGKKVRPPLWAHRWKLGTVYQQNKKGQFFGWTLKLKSEPPVSCRMRLDDELYQQGRAFYELLKEGKARVEHSAGGGNPDGASGGGAAGGEEIPF